MVAYNVYWLLVIGQFSTMRYKEDKGHWPLLKAKRFEDDEQYLTTQEE